MSACANRWGLVLGALLVLSIPPVRADVKLPNGTAIETVDFERHIVALFGRAGCASGSCHGSFQGKGGFRLSLFGYDPAKDYLAVTRDAGGRRLDSTDPDKSLLFLKATGQTAHEGQVRFGKTTWQGQLLRTWITQGAKWKAGSGEVKSLSITPKELAAGKPGVGGQLKVQALFADGTKEDVSCLCEFRTNDESVAEVDNLGRVKTRRPGDTAIVVSYRGSVVPVRVLVPTVLPKGFKYPATPAVNYIDREVFAKLKRLNMVPSKLSTDTEFLRRVTLDTIGTLPTPDEVRKFLAEKSAKKREKKIDELLAHPMHAALWATKFCDITGNNTDGLENPPQRKPYLSQMWHDWFRKRVAKNMPYDEIVKGVMTATSRDGRSAQEYIDQVEEFEGNQDRAEKTNYAERATLDLFWRKQGRVTVDQWGEKTAAAFLGVRLECAQCHKHPFDRWTQIDYRSYANIFVPVQFGFGPDEAKLFRTVQQERQKKTLERQKQLKMKGKAKAKFMPLTPLREVFIAKTAKGALPHPDFVPGINIKGKKAVAPPVLPPKALGGPAIEVEAGEDPRVPLFEWMKSENNPYFARAFVNRIWGHYFGQGIVHPVDDFSLANPPSNDKLLAALAKDFQKNKFDIRKMEKTILMSRTYQLSCEPNETNKFDKVNYARSYVRPLMAEVVVDMLNAALGVGEKWGAGEAPAGSRAIEVGASRVGNPNVNYIFNVFGRPPRTSACDCERAMDPALPQKLFLLADANLQAKLKAPTNRLGTFLGGKGVGKVKPLSDDKAFEELVLATVSRFPTEKEKKLFTDYRAEKIGEGDATAAQRREVFTDVLWALINTKEFIFNH